MDEKYLNKDLDAKIRAKDLLERMTLKEKVGQLNQRLYGFRIFEKQGQEIHFTDELKAEVKDYSGLGVLYGLYRADPWSGKDYENGLSKEMAVKAYNQLQQYVLEHSRLKIPFSLSTECPHGHQALDGYVLPVNLAVGATFHPELLKEAAMVCGEQLRKMGVNLALVSVLDILRDPRWGRSEECYSEDPYLAGCFARSEIEGMQSQGVLVVAKHFCAQGQTTGGVNASAASIGERELREIHLPVVEECCKAGVKGIMAAYNEIDGVYCHGNAKLLQGILREEMGFDGVIMADGIAIDQLDVMTGDNIKSAAIALKAGIDISLWDEAFSKLDNALERSLVTEEEINRAVLRGLILKFEQGLFEKPYIGIDGERTDKFFEGSYFAYDYETYLQSQQLAEESVILLKNENHILPIKDKNLSIAVIGPNADDIYRQIGDYSPPIEKGKGRTVWEGMLEGGEGRTVTFSDGSNLLEAKEYAQKSDVVVLVLGGSSSRFGGAKFMENGAAVATGTKQMDCGEGIDASNLLLPNNQNQLFSVVKNTGVPVITVIIAGRPYAIPEIAENTDALLYAFYPGPMGGRALAKIIYGEISPSGRLPVSIPRSVGQLPVYYNYKKSYQAMHYYDQTNGALYSFGEGFGYSEFRYSKVKLSANKDEGNFVLECMVENMGNFDDYTVLQCYRSIQSSEVVPRVLELKAFRKVFVEKGTKKKAELQFNREMFQIFGADGIWKEEKGTYHLILKDHGEEIWRGQIECI